MAESTIRWRITENGYLESYELSEDCKCLICSLVRFLTMNISAKIGLKRWDKTKLINKRLLP
jgi:hypothetical protein